MPNAATLQIKMNFYVVGSLPLVTANPKPGNRRCGELRRENTINKAPEASSGSQERSARVSCAPSRFTGAPEFLRKKLLRHPFSFRRQMQRI